MGFQSSFSSFWVCQKFCYLGIKRALSWHGSQSSKSDFFSSNRMDNFQMLTTPIFLQFNMSPTSTSMAGYPYGSSSGYAGAMYAAAASTPPTTKEPFSSSLVSAGDSINSLRLKAKQHSTPSSSPYYPAASVSPGKSNSSESPNLTSTASAANTANSTELYNNGDAGTAAGESV